MTLKVSHFSGRNPWLNMREVNQEKSRMLSKVDSMDNVLTGAFCTCTPSCSVHPGS